MDEVGKPNLSRIYRGAYDYTRNDSTFSEETYEVYKHNREYTHNFISQTLSRVPTGELLKITVDYTFSKDWLPLTISIIKSLGNQSVEEKFSFNNKNNLLTYEFIPKDGKPTVEEIPMPPKFHIATPCTAASMAFLKSKKFDQTSDNQYVIYSSNNMWKYKETLVSKNIGVRRISVTSDTIKYQGKELQGFQYEMYDVEDKEREMKKKKHEVKEKVPMLSVFLSKHLTIPYIVEDTATKTEVSVRYLNDLNDD